MRKRDYLILAGKGFLMGVADLIPGISGGTIALMVGIYERLIDAIHSFDVQFARRLLTFRWREAWAGTDWKFLAAVLTGIMTAIFSLSHLVKWLLEAHPVLIQSFFFGLVLATVPLIAKRLPAWTSWMIVSSVAAAAGMYVLTGLLPMHTDATPLLFFLSGAVAICAMILPGISGAFILLLVGKYHQVIDAVHDRNLAVIGLVGLGCAVGLLSFVRVLKQLLARYHDWTIAVLTGLVAGSLRKIWPWKDALDANVLPSINVALFGAVALMVSGFFIAMLLGERGNDA